MLTEVQDRDAIVARAIEIASAEERDAYIAEACGNDADLRQQVKERVAAQLPNGNSHRSDEADATVSLPATPDRGPASTNRATDLASSPSTLSQVWTLLRKRPRALAGVVMSQLVLLAAAAAGTSLGVWAWRAEEQARGAAHEALEERDRAQKLAKQAQDQVEQAETARRSTEKERDRAVEAERAIQRSEEDTKAVLAFFNNNVLTAGRPIGWAGGQGKDVSLRKALDAAESKVAGAFADRPLAEASIREMLGAAYLDLEEAPVAVKQLERALALREALQGEEHPDTTACRNKLAVAYRLAGRSDEASRLYDQKLNSSSRASALAARGLLLLSQKKPTEAELKLRECLAIRQKLQPDDWATFDAKSMLGEALRDQKKYAEAEPLLLSGYEGMKQHEDTIPSQDKHHLTSALERLVHLYEAWGKQDKAARWRKELEAAEASKKP